MRCHELAHLCACAGKLVAFSGPQGATRYYCGFKAKQPEDYWQYFKRRGVSAVVRLNNKVSVHGGKPVAVTVAASPALTHDACTACPVSKRAPFWYGADWTLCVQLYESSRFTDGGFRHHELYFPDGSCPSDAILQQFLRIAEEEHGASVCSCTVEELAMRSCAHKQQAARLRRELELAESTSWVPVCTMLFWLCLQGMVLRLACLQARWRSTAKLGWAGRACSSART